MHTIIVCVALLALAASPVLAAKQKTQCRDAKTGEFVSVKYAKKYPGLTVCETKTDVLKKKQG